MILGQIAWVQPLLWSYIPSSGQCVAVHHTRSVYSAELFYNSRERVFRH